MSKFKVGDKVAAYMADEYGSRRFFGTVKQVVHLDYLIVGIPGRPNQPFHPKQCRKLIPPRRRVWVNTYTTGTVHAAHESKKDAIQGAAGDAMVENAAVEFVEVRRKKRP